MSISAEREAFRKSFDLISMGLRSQSILYETVPLLTQHGLIANSTASDVIQTYGMPPTQKVSLVMQELHVQILTSPTAFKIILHDVLKAKHNLYHLYVKLNDAYMEELRQEALKEATDSSASYYYMTDAQQSRKVSQDEPITNQTPHRNISQDSGISMSSQLSREQFSIEGTTLDDQMLKMKIDDEAQDGSSLPPTPQPKLSCPLFSSPRPNDIPPQKAPPLSSSTPKALTNPVTHSERRSLARMPMSEQSQEYDSSDLVMPTRASVACEDTSCPQCVMKQEEIFLLQDENRSLQEMKESDDKSRRADRCFILEKLNEIDELRDRLKSKDEQMKRLKNALCCVERKCKEFEEGDYYKTIERHAEKLRKEMEQAKKEKAQLENELRQQYMYIEQMKEHAQKLKNIIVCERQEKVCERQEKEELKEHAQKLENSIVCERQEKEELRKMCFALREKNEQLENALSLATTYSTTTHSSS